MTGITCPSCGRGAQEGDFLCTRCETILDPDVLLDDPLPPREPTVVRALLSPPEATLRRQRPEPPPELQGGRKTSRGNTKTRVFIIPFELTDVPTVVAGLDLKVQKLSTFEAFALSMVDGRSSLDSLRQALSLGKMEVQTLAVSLVDRKLLKMNPPEAMLPPPPPRRKAEPAPPPPLIDFEPLPAVAQQRQVKPPPPVEVDENQPLPEIKRVVPPGLARPLRPERQPTPLPPPRPVAPRPAPPAPARPAFEEPRSKGPVPQHVYESPLQRAITLEKSGRMKECIAHLEHAIETSADPAPLYNRLALVLLKERRDLKGAEALLHRALEHDPDSDVYRQNLLKILMMSGATTGKKKVPRR